MLRRILMMSLPLALMGCATVRDNYTPERTQISFPQIGTTQTVTLGEQMLKQGTATTTKGVQLQQENNIGGFVLSPGFYPQQGEDEKYVFTTFDTRSNDPDVGTVTLGGGVFGQVVLPRAIRFSKAKQETCAISPNMYGMNQPVCDTEYGYSFGERPFVSANDFQQTLIYSGRVGDRIRISYREFSGSLARSAFTNEAEYDLSDSNIIAYKGARLRVIEADNESITYEVISNFNVQ